MTSGIYQLNFNDQAYYIGQSQDLEARWKQHADKFLKGKSAKKMQDAYDKHGMPNARILIECHKDYLDIMENYYISIQKQYENCLNTTAPALDPKVNYEWLLQNTHMLKFSSIEIMGDFVNTVKEKTELEAKHEIMKRNLDNRFLAARATAELREGKDENAELVAYNTEKIAHIESELARIKSRGFLDRIFNHQ